MSAPPWMPLYIAEYLADTGHLTTVEHGAYMLLIMHYWQHDGLPADEHKLARICRMTMAEWSAARDTIADFFDEGWRHGRIDREITAARETMARRSAAGRAGASARHGNRTAKAMAIALQTNTPAGNGVCLDTSQSGQPEEGGGSARDEFAEAFWPAYPHKVGEVRAREAFEAARERGASLEDILAGLDRYRATKPAATRWMNPETFLVDERWRDEPAPPEEGPAIWMTWVAESDALWSAVAARWAREKGSPLRPYRSQRQSEPGAYIPSDWIEKAAA